MHPLTETKTELEKRRDFFSKALAECEEKISEIEQFRETVLTVREANAVDEQKFGESTKELKSINEALTLQKERRAHLKKTLMQTMSAQAENDGEIIDDQMKVYLLDLVEQVRRIKGTKTRLVNHLTHILELCRKLKDFKGSAPSYSQDIMKYYDPSLEMQETILAIFKAAGLITDHAAGFSKYQAEQKADVYNMIKTPLSLMDFINNPHIDEPLEGEWAEATAEDLEEPANAE